MGCAARGRPPPGQDRPQALDQLVAGASGASALDLDLASWRGFPRLPFASSASRKNLLGFVKNDTGSGTSLIYREINSQRSKNKKRFLHEPIVQQLSRHFTCLEIIRPQKVGPTGTQSSNFLVTWTSYTIFLSAFVVRRTSKSGVENLRIFSLDV